MTLPARAPGPDLFGHDPPVPELDVLLVGAHVVQEAQPDHGRTHEAAALGPHSGEQALYQVGLDEHVVVEEKGERRPRLRQQEVPVLGHAPPRAVAVHVDLVAPGLQQPQDSLSLGSDSRLGLFGLVRHDDPHPRDGLACDRGERGGQRRRPPVGRDQDVYPFGHGVRATQAVIAFGPPPLAPRRPGCDR